MWLEWQSACLESVRPWVQNLSTTIGGGGKPKIELKAILSKPQFMSLDLRRGIPEETLPLGLFFLNVPQRALAFDVPGVSLF
jgi:hypothetical protein